MKAITYSRYGSPDVLELKQVNKPHPKDNEVLINVKAVEVTKTDCEMRSCQFPVKWFWLPLRIALGITKPKRQILGGYFAGEICALGKGVTQFSVGDPIFGAAQFRLGAYGEYIALPETYTLVAKPDNMSFAEAAAVPIGGLNALHFMRLAQIKPGERVLIIGAGGSIGAHAVQIAKSFQAEVTAVDSGLKRDFVVQLGADHFVDYTTEDVFSRNLKYDVILNMSPKTSYSACIEALNDHGRYLLGNPKLLDMVRAGLTTRRTNKKVLFEFAKETKEELLALKQMIESGQIKPIVNRICTMEQAAEAHKLVETEQRIGAVVIAMPE